MIVGRVFLGTLMYSGTKNDDVSHWNFSLPTVYYQGLTEEVKMKLIEKKEDGGMVTSSLPRINSGRRQSRLHMSASSSVRQPGVRCDQEAREVVMNWVYRASNNVHKGKRSVPSHSQHWGGAEGQP
jgi:hypothetical protein